MHIAYFHRKISWRQ